MSDAEMIFAIVAVLAFVLSAASIILSVFSLKKATGTHIKLEHEISTAYKSAEGELQKQPTTFTIKVMNSGRGDIRLKELGIMARLSGIWTRIVMGASAAPSGQNEANDSSASQMPRISLSTEKAAGGSEGVLRNSSPLYTTCDAGALYDFLYANNARGRIWLYAEDSEGHLTRQKSLSMAELKKMQPVIDSSITADPAQS